MAVNEDKQLSYGWLRFRPTWLQFLNTPKWFLFFLSQYFFALSIVVNGIYPGSISTIEKRFGFSSLKDSLGVGTDQVLILSSSFAAFSAERTDAMLCTVDSDFIVYYLALFVSWMLAQRLRSGDQVTNNKATAWWDLPYYRYKMGMVTSSYEIAAMILVPLMGYIGGSRKRPVFCSWGVFTMGVGFFIFMLPHFISPPYEGGAILNATQRAPDSQICAANRSDFDSRSECKKDTSSGDNLYYALFILGMVVAGAGYTPLYSLGIPYIVENVKSKVSSMYIGIFVACGICGAAVGFLLLSKFLAMFVETGVQTSLTMYDERWVGNWWLGFAIFGAICVFWSIWLLGFPKRLPLTQKQWEPEQAKNNTAVKPEEKEIIYSKLKDLPKATMLVFSSLPFVFLTAGACSESFLYAVGGAFMPKVVETLFYQPPGRAALLYGLIAVPCAFVGNLLGAYIHKRLKLNLTGSARMCFIISVFGLVFTSFLYIKCDTPNIAGVNARYPNSSNPVQLSSPCNQACNCSRVSYTPVCGGPLTYFSPCHAGCSQVNTTNKASVSYSHCACVVQSDKALGEVKRGNCYVDCKVDFFLYMVVVSLITFVAFLKTTPVYIVTLRSVPPGQRSFALGLHKDLIGILGAVPGPIVFGALLDKTCILWSSRCGNQGHCLEYDHHRLALVVVSVFVTFRLITVICFSLSWFFCRRVQAKERITENNNERENEDDRCETVQL